MMGSGSVGLLNFGGPIGKKAKQAEAGLADLRKILSIAVTLDRSDRAPSSAICNG
jgi:hypothetical protein